MVLAFQPAVEPALQVFQTLEGLRVQGTEKLLAYRAMYSLDLLCELTIPCPLGRKGGGKAAYPEGGQARGGEVVQRCKDGERKFQRDIGRHRELYGRRNLRFVRNNAVLYWRFLAHLEDRGYRPRTVERFHEKLRTFLRWVGARSVRRLKRRTSRRCTRPAGSWAGPRYPAA